MICNISKQIRLKKQFLKSCFNFCRQIFYGNKDSADKRSAGLFINSKATEPFYRKKFKNGETNSLV